MEGSPPLLEVRDLTTRFHTGRGVVHAVDGVSWSLRAGESIAIVGESGSGKSVSALSLMGLVPPPGRVESGEVVLSGRNLLRLDRRTWQDVRGREIAMVFQDPMTSLNPVLTVGYQLAEGVRRHLGTSRAEARAEALRLLDLVGIPDANERLSSFPHQFSGGQRQRLMIAMALACKPAVLIADEPTTALDVTIQDQIVRLIKDLQTELGTAIVWITHDLALAAGLVDRILVMYAGSIVEEAGAAELFRAARHPHTLDLLASLPSIEGRRGSRAAAEGRPPPARTVVEVRDLKTHFPIRKGFLRRQVGVVRAVDGVSFDVVEGETLGLVGESGSGKSTIARTLLRLVAATSGSVTFRGRELAAMSAGEMRAARRDVQMIFQDPYASLNPRHRVRRIVREPMDIYAIGTSASRGRRVAELLERVGLAAAHAERYPHELSGGQRQRVGIARALATSPRLVVADEPLSALDVSIQAQIVELLEDLRAELGLTYLFITHDLSRVRQISHRIAVMYLGRIVELGATDDVFDRPRHPYTRALIAAIPVADPEHRSRAARSHTPVAGDVPSPASPPSGCRFHPRCPLATELCHRETPLQRAVDPRRPSHVVACHHARIEEIS